MMQLSYDRKGGWQEKQHPFQKLFERIGKLDEKKMEEGKPKNIKCKHFK